MDVLTKGLTLANTAILVGGGVALYVHARNTRVEHATFESRITSLDAKLERDFYERGEKLKRIEDKLRDISRRVDSLVVEQIERQIQADEG